MSLKHPNIMMISIHGLIRGHDLELGRDPDTGGQIKYVIELVKALSHSKGVGRVDLVTRKITDASVGPSYSKDVEPLCERAWILRIPCGSGDYIRKERLWEHLDSFTDNLANQIVQTGRRPDLIHSHYADAGFVGAQLSNRLGIPLIHTGHSLGRVKRRRLLASGLTSEEIEKQFNMSQRIEAEEHTLATADRIVTSTRQEKDEQYALYDQYQPELMTIIPPGVDLERFYPPVQDAVFPAAAERLKPFLREPDKPLIVAISRADTRKNVAALIKAFGESAELQSRANLLIVLGSRKDIIRMEEEPREVLTELLLLIDRYNLYGKVAYPKRHDPDEVPEFYRLASSLKGVFVNTALTEPFGLTLLEAAASRLPVVATKDGGPQDILANCKNGILIDPMDPKEIAQGILEILSSCSTWQRFADKGLEGVRRCYSWTAHSKTYLHHTLSSISRSEVLPRKPFVTHQNLHSDRAIITDLDQNLLGDPSHIPAVLAQLRKHRKECSFGIATGRTLRSAVKKMRAFKIPEPDVLFANCGSEIYYAPDFEPDRTWARHIDHRWTPHEVRDLLSDLPGITLQPREKQGRFKISYYIDVQKAPSLDQINSLLRKEDQAVNVFLSFGQFLDILPIRASKGFALRYFASRWGIPVERIMAVGGSATDEDMVRGNSLAVVVSNRHDEELQELSETDGIFFARSSHAQGILEAIEYYDFFNACRAPKATARRS